MEQFLNEINDMNLEQVLERKTQLETEIRSAENTESIADMDKKIEAINQRIAELKDFEQRKAQAEAIKNGEAEGAKVVESRKEKTMTNDREMRAKALVETKKVETRALLSTGDLAKPTKVDGVNGLADTLGTIVDDVKAVPLTGNGAYTVAYKDSEATSVDVTDGLEIGGTEAEFKTVTINPSEWGTVGTISKQVAKVSPLTYLNELEGSALDSLRAKAETKILAAIQASDLAEKVTLPLDQDYLRMLFLGFKSIKGKGAVKLYINRNDLTVLAKVRGTNEKKALYEIKFDEGSNVSGTISEGGFATRFSIEDELEDGVQLFGQPLTVEMPMWDKYTIETDESVYFTKNLIAYRGIQTANADLCAKHGMQIVSNS